MLAAGVRHHYFGRDDWEAVAPGLKSLEDATTLRRRILYAFEAAELEDDPEALGGMADVRGGFGAGRPDRRRDGRPPIGELYASLDPAPRVPEDRRGQATHLAPRGGKDILSSFAAELSGAAMASLARLGVMVSTGCVVTDVRPGSVTFRRGEAIETVAAHTVVWAAGVKGSSLGAALATAAGAELDPSGRVKVLADFSLPGHPDVFVIGDLAAYEATPGRTLPGVAQPARQAGAYVARLILARRLGRTTPAFRYDDRGSMATIGRNAAIAQVGRFRFSGSVACGMWMFIHLLFIEQCHNRLPAAHRVAAGLFHGCPLRSPDRSASSEETAPSRSNRLAKHRLLRPHRAPSSHRAASRLVDVSPDENGVPA